MNIKSFLKKKGLDMITCQLCGKQFTSISNSHLRRKHGLTSIQEYYAQFPDAEKNPPPFIRKKQQEVLSTEVSPVETKKIENKSVSDPLVKALFDDWKIR